MRSEPYLVTPRPGSGVCPDCFNFMLTETGRCRACRANESHLDAIVPISYAPGGSRLHHELADYKRTADPFVPPLMLELATILSGFLARHERCVARAVGVERFSHVTTVPSSDALRDQWHPLRRIVGRLVAETGDRHERLLAPAAPGVEHRFVPDRFRALRELAGATVLLIDDVWTTGASAQGAAAALKRAGAQVVAAVVIGRYVNGWWGETRDRLEQLPAADAAACVLCAERRTTSLAA